MVLLHLLRWLRNNSDIGIETHIVQPGPLLEAYLQVSPVFFNGRQLRTAADVNQRGHFMSLLPKIQGQPRLRNKYDLVYSNTVTNGALLAQFVQRGSTKVITHVHEMDYWVGRAGQENWKLVVNYTDLFIAASIPVAEMLQRRGIPAERIRVVEEFIGTEVLPSIHQDAVAIRRRYGIPEDAFVVAGSGAETLRKGKDLFVQLAGLISRSLPGERPYFLWVGYDLDPEPAYWAAHDARMLGLEHRIIWTGEVDDPLTHLAACDAFTLLSREDPFPLVCLEAALLGKPVTCFTGSGGIPYLVEDDAGAVVPYLDIQAMAKKLVEWRSTPALRRQLGQRASEKVKERYAVDVQAPKIHALILQLLEDQGNQ